MLTAFGAHGWRRETLARAGKAFEGLEALLGGGRSGTFDLQARAPSLFKTFSPPPCAPIRIVRRFFISASSIAHHAAPCDKQRADQWIRSVRIRCSL